MKLVDPFQQLDVYHFWRVQTHNVTSTNRRYEVRVNHDHHYYEASARSVGAAVAAVLVKIKAGFEKSVDHRQRRRHVGVPMLKLAGYEDEMAGPKEQK